MTPAAGSVADVSGDLLDEPHVAVPTGRDAVGRRIFGRQRVPGDGPGGRGATDGAVQAGNPQASGAGNGEPSAAVKGAVVAVGNIGQDARWVIRPRVRRLNSLNQRLPSGPAAMPAGKASGEGTSNSVMAPVTVIHPNLVATRLGEPKVSVGADFADPVGIAVSPWEGERREHGAGVGGGGAAVRAGLGGGGAGAPGAQSLGHQCSRGAGRSGAAHDGRVDAGPVRAVVAHAPADGAAARARRARAARGPCSNRHTGPHRPGTSQARQEPVQAWLQQTPSGLHGESARQPVAVAVQDCPRACSGRFPWRHRSPCTSPWDRRRR